MRFWIILNELNACTVHLFYKFRGRIYMFSEDLSIHGIDNPFWGNIKNSLFNAISSSEVWIKQEEIYWKRTAQSVNSVYEKYSLQKLLS